MANYQYIQVRQISWQLVVGIVLLPCVFAWALLGRGYSNIARVFSFGWMLIVTVPMMGGILSGATQTPVQSSTAAAKTQPQSETATTEEAPAPQAAESKWVSYYGDYYVTCYLSNGGRYYIAINQKNPTDAQMNATPSDEMWAQVCGRG